jgi:spore maturation protein CgeB
VKIIYLSPNVADYGAAFYQRDVIDELSRQHEVFLYGPGYADYEERDGLTDVIGKSPFTSPDLLCLGHQWLRDAPGVPLVRHPQMDLTNSNMPRVMILNKEYARLQEKLSFVRANRMDLVFTHHHAAEKYTRETGVRFVYWPFAVNHHHFKDYGLTKEYDLIFTGLLRNPTWSQTQNDVRVRVQRKLFYTLGQLRLCRRPEYRGYRFFWRAVPSSPLIAGLNALVHGERRLPAAEYFRLLNRGRVCLNALSPVNLISTRYYEAMACKCLVFCQESPLYRGLFEEGEHCVTFRDDLSDFAEKLVFYLDHEETRQVIVERAFQHVLTSHTWQKRIAEFTDAIASMRG